MMGRATVQYLSDPAFFAEKEAAYLRARRLEGRLLSDEAVVRLPHLPRSRPIVFGRLPFALCPLPFEQEWRWRRRSFERLRKYLLKKHAQQPLRILDLGCGNGWMSNRLAEQPQWEVWAVDLNETELEQGARCFASPNLRFVYADVLAGVLPQNGFDVVVLAASVQYFSDLPALWAVLHKLLTISGEIHVADSHFYQNEVTRAAARQRTVDYYTRLGVPEMAAFYHHHLWADAAAAGAENLNGGWWARLLQKAKWLAPFPWLRIGNRLSIFAAEK